MFELQAGRSDVPKIYNLTGRRFGRLTIAGRAEGPAGHVWWAFVCDCGATGRAHTGELNSGGKASCGCGQRDAAANACRSRAMHNGRGSRLYTIWRAMRTRCGRPTAINYSLYGGRGIRVCAEWDASFTAFREWAVPAGYHDGLSIDRIDSDGDYRPDNCRWATPKEQANNRRNNRARAA